MSVYIPVVGNHYTGNSVKSGELVMLSPEPDNPVDPQAICIVNVEGEKLGYVPKMQTVKYRKYIGSLGNIFPYKRGYRIKI